MKPWALYNLKAEPHPYGVRVTANVAGAVGTSPISIVLTMEQVEVIERVRRGIEISCEETRRDV